METENKVWVVSGEDWNEERGTRIVIGVCPTEEDAENLKLQFENEYDNIWIQEFYPKTWDRPSIIYNGHFKVEIRPFIKKHYILHKVEIMEQEREVLPAGYGPKEKFEFSVGHIIKTDGPEVYIIVGEFTSMEKVPTEGKAAKEWIAQKVNEKGLITLESF